MKKFKKTIGIIGGMGPGASAHLYQRIMDIAATEYGAAENDDFPEVILYSVPVPDFISSSDQREKALLMISERVKRLNGSSIDIMAIACNTAHVLLPKIQKVSQVPFVSLIEAVSKKVTVHTIGVLATSATIQAELYQSHFPSDKKLLFPKDQESVDILIRKILAKQAGKKEKEALVSIANSLQRQGAEAILLGCTELPLLFPKKYSLPVLNSIDILARALLDESML